MNNVGHTGVVFDRMAHGGVAGELLGELVGPVTYERDVM